MIGGMRIDWTRIHLMTRKLGQYPAIQRCMNAINDGNPSINARFGSFHISKQAQIDPLEWEEPAAPQPISLDETGFFFKIWKNATVQTELLAYPFDVPVQQSKWMAHNTLTLTELITYNGLLGGKGEPNYTPMDAYQIAFAAVCELLAHPQGWTRQQVYASDDSFLDCHESRIHYTIVVYDYDASLVHILTLFD